jgi:hypothetical protein
MSSLNFPYKLDVSDLNKNVGRERDGDGKQTGRTK